jgi:hypothetical protein
MPALQCDERKVYLRMSADGFPEFGMNGGGRVNLQDHRGAWEQIKVIALPEHGFCAIGSLAFEGAYVRGAPTTKDDRTNCQNHVGAWERFRIFPASAYDVLTVGGTPPHKVGFISAAHNATYNTPEGPVVHGLWLTYDFTDAAFGEFGGGSVFLASFPPELFPPPLLFPPAFSETFSASWTIQP